jgi:hypothetical protein
MSVAHQHPWHATHHRAHGTHLHRPRLAQTRTRTVYYTPHIHIWTTRPSGAHRRLPLHVWEVRHRGPLVVGHATAAERARWLLRPLNLSFQAADLVWQRVGIEWRLVGQ